MSLNNSAGAAVTAQPGNEQAATVQPDADIAHPFPIEDGDSVLIGDHDAASQEDSQPSATEGDSDGDADADADGEDSPAEDGGTAEAEQKGNKVPAKDRIKQLSDRAKQAIRERDESDARVRSLEAQLAKVSQRDKPGEAADYESDADYAQALVKEAVHAAKEETLAEARQEALQQREVARRNEWLEKSAEMRDRVTDFDSVVANENAPISLTMRDAIVSDTAGPEIAYFLGKNPKEAAKIAALSPLQQAAAIGRLGARFENAPEPKKVTKAPAVRQKLDGHGSPPSRNPAKMTMEEYISYREEINANKAKAKGAHRR